MRAEHGRAVLADARGVRDASDARGGRGVHETVRGGDGSERWGVLRHGEVVVRVEGAGERDGGDDGEAPEDGGRERGGRGEDGCVSEGCVGTHGTRVGGERGGCGVR